MKKILFALILFSITPLCAMKRENTEKKPERTPQEQWELAMELSDAIFDVEARGLNPNMVTHWLKQGANLNAQTPNLFFTLDSRVVRILLDYGIDMLQPNRDGDALFHSLEFKKIALWLLHAQERRLDLNTILSQADKNGRTPRAAAEHAMMFEREDDTENNSDTKPPRSPKCARKAFLILTDPNKYIPLLCPDVVKQFEKEQIDAEFKKTSTRSIREYLFFREIGGKR